MSQHALQAVISYYMLALLTTYNCEKRRKPTMVWLCRNIVKKCVSIQAVGLEYLPVKPQFHRLKTLHLQAFENGSSGIQQTGLKKRRVLLE